MHKVERLINLIALLLNTRRPLTVEEIRNTVPGYQQQDYSSFKRMFERDKEELRSLGIPIERRFTDVWEIDEGYLISPERYYLPELDLTPDEMAALWIASSIVVEPPGSESRALTKLSLGGGALADPTSPPWLRARLHLDSVALPQLLDGVATRRRVIFRYKAADQKKDVERTVEPYALIHRQGAWYLAGRDQMRSAVRHFKLARITSGIKFASRGPGPDFDVPEDFSTDIDSVREPWMGEKGTNVEVAFSPRLAWWVVESLGLESKGMWKDWTLVGISVTDEEGFISWVIGFGEDAIVRSPDRVRKAVIKRLRASTNAHRRAPVKRTGGPVAKKAKPRARVKAKR